MSEEKALIPIEQRAVDFYGDEIVAVMVEMNDQQQVQVPIRPICDYLGLSWAGQRQRIHRDEILAEVSSECVIHSQGQRRAMLCLPLDYLNGWLFGVNASRVKPEIKASLLRYQRECYRILADAFLPPALNVRPASSDDQALIQLHNMALVIAATTREMLELRQLSLDNKTRLDAAREYLRGMNKRLNAVEERTQLVEERLQTGALTEAQAREVQQRVNLIAQALTKYKPDAKHHLTVYEALRQETGATSYKNIPPKGYQAALAFLENWLNAIERAGEGDGA